MKIVLKALAALFFLFLVGVGVVFHVTGNMAKEAEAFFTAVKASDYPKAMSHLSEEFRASTARQDLVAFVESSALARFKSVSWSSRSAAPGSGELKGTVTTDGGGSIPLKVKFVRESGHWRINAIDKERAGLNATAPTAQPPPVAAPVPAPTPVQEVAPKGPVVPAAPAATGPPAMPPSVPSLPSVAHLTKVTMSKVARSISAKDVSFLLGASSSSPAEVEERRQQFSAALKPFMDAPFDVSHLVREEPVLKPAPAIDQAGRLSIAGHYPERGGQITFAFTFIERGGQRELTTISLSKARRQ